eukprot:1607613-Pyramimonas_sp.AAC.2
MDKSWVPDLASRRTEPSFWDSRTALSLVTGDHEASRAPPLHTAHLDSRSVVGFEASFQRLRLTKLPHALSCAFGFEAREYTHSGHQSHMGRENIPVTGTNPLQV